MLGHVEISLGVAQTDQMLYAIDWVSWYSWSNVIATQIHELGLVNN